MADLLSFERDYFSRNIRLIAGVDEVGRGPLAGPVTVCALIPDFSDIIEGINDSKKLSDKKRRAFYPLIKEKSIDYKVVSVSEKDIDEINILEATKRAMREAITSLVPVPEIVFIDAVNLDGTGLRIKPIIHGDALSYSIAAASVIAKVTRDNLMLSYAELYPEYGFDENKGYGTAHHIEMLKKYGPCPIHRRSFIKNFFGGDKNER